MVILLREGQMLKILTVVPLQKVQYGKVFPTIIRALDLTKDESNEIVFIHDGITAGTTEYVVECVNKIQASMTSRGYDIRLKRVPTDFNLHGKNAPAKWALEQLGKGVDYALVIDDSSRKDIPYFVEQCEKAGVECLVVTF